MAILGLHHKIGKLQIILLNFDDSNTAVLYTVPVSLSHVNRVAICPVF